VSAVSSAGCELVGTAADEQCSHGFLGCLVCEAESWSLVEFCGDSLKILNGMDREVGVLGEVLVLTARLGEDVGVSVS
jgi:hypothetical protein